MSNDGLSLFGRTWISPTTKPKGVIHLIHGLGEHSGRYAHVAEAFGEAGYHLASFDLRGHGLSEGKKGHTPDFDHLLNDIKIFFHESSQKIGNKLPKFLYGHSLGGNLAINFVLQTQNYLNGAIVTSPALSTTSPPPKIKIILAKVMAKVMPSFSLKNGLETDALSRDTAIVKAYIDDVYVHDRLSARLGLDLLESGQYALENAAEWSLPLLLMHGTADRITSHQASKQFAEKAKEKVELVLWEDYYHELHNDIDNEQVIAKMINWLDKKSTPSNHKLS